MSKETKQALNLYGILDNELDRMHELLKTFLQLPTNPNRNTYPTYASEPDHNIPMIYKRIMHIQDTLIKAVYKHDELVQEKVAELALTGEESDEV